MEQARIYKKSLGQFSRDAWSKEHPQYDQGTSAADVHGFFQEITGMNHIGSHAENAGYSVINYYVHDPHGTTVRAEKGLSEVIIHLFGVREAIAHTAGAINQRFQNKK